MSTIVTRAGKGSALTWTEADANFTNLNNDKAELVSPTFTGTPSAPTAVVGTNTTQVATTAYTKAEIASDRPYSDTNPLMDGTAAQGSSTKVSRQDHVHPSDTTKASLAGATFTGQVKGITPVSADDLTRKDYVDGKTASGTYTPTFSSYSNCSGASVKNSRPWRYTQIGNIISFSGTLTLTVNTASFTYFYFTLPVAGNIANDADGTGSGYARNTADSPVAVSAYAADDSALAQWTSSGTGTTTVYLYGEYLIQ